MFKEKRSSWRSTVEVNSKKWNVNALQMHGQHSLACWLIKMTPFYASQMRCFDGNSFCDEFIFSHLLCFFFLLHWLFFLSNDWWYWKSWRYLLFILLKTKRHSLSYHNLKSHFNRFNHVWLSQCVLSIDSWRIPFEEPQFLEMLRWHIDICQIELDFW